MVQGGPPKTTTKAEELCSSEDVDIVLICNRDEHHVTHGILALKYNKWCLIEKPLALCFRDINDLITAEKVSKGKVFVGTMRHFAPAFLEAVKEVGGQSGTYPENFSDFKSTDVEDSAVRETDMVRCALEDEFGVAVTEDSIRMLRILGSLNTHDLSAMREIIGMPKSVLGACLSLPGIYSALFECDGFGVTFESGVNSVPVFDAQIEVCVVNGKPIKSSADDAKNELELYKMILKAGENSYKTTPENCIEIQTRQNPVLWLYIQVLQTLLMIQHDRGINFERTSCCHYLGPEFGISLRSSII